MHAIPHLELLDLIQWTLSGDWEDQWKRHVLPFAKILNFTTRSIMHHEDTQPLTDETYLKTWTCMEMVTPNTCTCRSIWMTCNHVQQTPEFLSQPSQLSCSAETIYHSYHTEYIKSLSYIFTIMLSTCKYTLCRIIIMFYMTPFL